MNVAYLKGLIDSHKAHYRNNRLFVHKDTIPKRTCYFLVENCIIRNYKQTKEKEMCLRLTDKTAETLGLISEEENQYKGALLVYIMYDASGLCKIGKTTNINKRYTQMKTGNPTISILRAYIAYIGAEQNLHDKFKNQRVTGEWFKLTKEDILWMDDKFTHLPPSLIKDEYKWK